jgi:hypothetical protein
MRAWAGGRCLTPFVAVLLVLLAPNGAAAATVVNGDFESGTLTGWHVHRATEAGNWFAYKGTDAPIGSKRGADPVQAPPEGTYAGTSDEANPDTLILYQDIALEPGYSHRLSLLTYYNTYEPIATPTPDTLSVDDEILAGQANQQYRIDVMRPGAPIESIDPADILRTLFRTEPGDPAKMPPTRFTANLSSFAGQTVRLRIANAAHEEVLNAGVDAVSVSSTAPGQLPPGDSKPHAPGSKPHAPNRFKLGKARANRRNGTTTLRVAVPGPGLLTVKGYGAPSSARTARPSKAKKSRKLIEPVTVRVAMARTLTVRLKPTPPARAILRQKHKLRVKVRVTYTPTGGRPEAASLPVVLKLDPHPRHRR